MFVVITYFITIIWESIRCRFSAEEIQTARDVAEPGVSTLGCMTVVSGGLKMG